jgi:hypothetical protein
VEDGKTNDTNAAADIVPIIFSFSPQLRIISG